MYGVGENIRDWIYVEDHCEGILNVFNNGKVGEKYNIGGECEVTNNDLVKTIIKMMNASEDLIEYVDDRPGHDLRYSISNAKIRSELNFSPKYSLEEGLSKTIDWYEKNKTSIEGAYIIQVERYEDKRGFFMESFNLKKFQEEIGNFNFVQDNHSLSTKGVLRGLHYQIKHPQGKLVRCTQGEIFDAIVDLRVNSPTYKRILHLSRIDLT